MRRYVLSFLQVILFSWFFIAGLNALAGPGAQRSCYVIFSQGTGVSGEDELWGDVPAEWRFKISETELRRTLSSSAGHRVWFERWKQAATHYWQIRQNLDINDDYNRKMDKVVVAAITKHFSRLFPEYETKKDARSRLKAIFEAVSHISVQEAHAGFFRVQRLVTGSYDLDQYLECH